MPEPAEILDRGYAAFNRGDIAALHDLMTPDFVWREAEEVPGRKTAIGREEFEDFLRGFERLWEGFSFELLELHQLADDLALATVRGHARGRASGEEMELVIHHLWRFRDGCVARMDAYLDENSARDAARLES